MEKYSKEELLNKLKELINKSEFISRDILDYAKNLDNGIELNKLVIYIYENLENEKNMNNEEKEKLRNDIININTKKTEIYNKFEKKARNDDEKNDKINDKINLDDELLNF